MTTAVDVRLKAQERSQPEPAEPLLLFLETSLDVTGLVPLPPMHRDCGPWRGKGKITWRHRNPSVYSSNNEPQPLPQSTKPEAALEGSESCQLCVCCSQPQSAGIGRHHSTAFVCPVMPKGSLFFPSRRRFQSGSGPSASSVLESVPCHHHQLPHTLCLWPCKQESTGVNRNKRTKRLRKYFLIFNQSSEARDLAKEVWRGWDGL